MKTKTCLICLLFIINKSISQEWKIKNIGSGVKPAIAADFNDRIHIAYMLEAGSGWVKHVMIDKENMTEETVDVGYFYGPLDLAIERNNLPAIAVHDHGLENQVVYRKGGGGNWFALETDHPGHDGWDNAIVFDDSGNIHTSSVDPQQFSGTGVEYGYYNGNSWNTEVIGSGSVPYMFSTGIALDNNSMPHITYYDAQGNNLVHAFKSGNNWMMEFIDSDGGMFSELISDSMGNLHVTYYSRIEGDMGSVRYAYYNGEGWNKETIDELSNTPISFGGARDVSAVALDGEGGVHVSYGDREVVKYAKKTENGWEIQTIVDYSGVEDELGAQTQIAVDREGSIHIAYFVLTSASPLTGEIKCATKERSTTNTIETSGYNVEIFPNPFSDAIHINAMSPHPEETEFTITDINGSKIISGILPRNQKISTNEIAPGIYILSLKSGKMISSTKLIKVN